MSATLDQARLVLRRHFGYGDFRPAQASYRAPLAARYRLGRSPTVALTGSATPAVRHEIARALGFGVGKFASTSDRSTGKTSGSAWSASPTSAIVSRRCAA
jgi:superfamily II DNA helicase RecQ